MQVSIVLAIAALCSCGGDSKTEERGTPASGPVAREDFLSRAAAAICDNIASCCSSEGYGFNRAGCEANVDATIHIADVPNTIWNDAAAEPCIDTLAAEATRCRIGAAHVRTTCKAILTGTLPEGAPCTYDVECAAIDGAEALCTFEGYCANPEDGAPLHGTVGDGCDGTCEGLACGPFGDREPLGISCFTQDGVVCSGTLRTCVKMPKLGEPCPDGWCDVGAYCDSDDSVCKTLQPDGASCVGGSQCSADNCYESVCGGAEGSLANPDICGQAS